MVKKAQGPTAGPSGGHTTEQRIEFANAFRGLAALAVVLSHYAGLFWSNRAIVSGLANVTALPDTVPTPAVVTWFDTMVPRMDWGSFGVALFFLISGFVIPFSLDRYTAAGFAIGRVCRIYPVYLVGFSCSLFGLFCGATYFGRQPSIPFTASDILVNYLPPLREIFGRPSIDGLVWTLEIELTFYAVCATGIRLFRRDGLAVFCIPAALSLLILILNCHLTKWLASDPALYKAAFIISLSGQFVVFMFVGVAFSRYYQRRMTAERLLRAVALLMLGFCLDWQSGPLTGIFGVVWSYCFALVLFTVPATSRADWRPIPPLRFLANISYPLYVSHPVAGYSLMRVLIAEGVSPVAAMVIALCGAVLLAWAIHVTVERPAHNLGKRLAARARHHSTLSIPLAPGPP